LRERIHGPPVSRAELVGEISLRLILGTNDFDALGLAPWAEIKRAPVAQGTPHGLGAREN
jgi:hypothetical protein